MSALPAIPQDLIEGNYGALFIGLIVATTLYGVACAQTIIYFHRWTKDRLLFKNVVILIWALDTAQLLLAIGNLYSWLITNYGIFTAIAKPSFFFARRVFIHGDSRRQHFVAWTVSILIVVLSLFMYALGCTMLTIAFHNQNNLDNTPSIIFKSNWMPYAYNISSAAADCTIACALCFALSRHGSGFKQTRSIILQLMTFSISSGVVTSAFALSAMVVYAIFPQYLISLAISWIIGQLHVNSLLLSLNSRTILRERYADPSTSGVFNTDISLPSRKSTHYAIPLKQTPAQVTISKEVTVSDYSSPLLCIPGIVIRMYGTFQST
ncbi:hypothetical protein CPB83DRAFT_893869 [Crepidotus variabilis]|uniref:DUF6534 domain-containing protein n=1 Tax=Crepidotus variabilis TaxID=179855 RepID=A0A9P6JQU0_9AGAR|nr:hypothetical protein CPB83DRAFT_893869 [Crepidotus variabilis]